MFRSVLLSLGLTLCLSGAAAGAENAVSEPAWQRLPETPPMAKADVSGRAPVNGIELYYAIFNKSGGEPVILLHGGLGSSDVWSFEVPKLAATHQVIVVDSRGHGHSARSAEPFSYQLLESDVVALMDYLNLPKASVVGWSDGGIIGMVMAIRHRERLAKLVTYGSNFSRAGEKTDPPDPGAKERGAKFMARMEASYRAVSPTPDGFAALRKALAAMYALEPKLNPAELRSIATPTLIIAGEFEQFYKREHFEELSRLIPGARFVILPNASHGGPNQQPEAFHKIVSDFLDAP